MDTFNMQPYERINRAVQLVAIVERDGTNCEDASVILALAQTHVMVAQAQMVGGQR